MVPDDLARKLKRAAEAVGEALDERDRLILEAFKTGASGREIGHHTGLSQTQVRRIAADQGWPSEAEKMRRAAAAERKRQDQAELDALIEQQRKRPRK